MVCHTPWVATLDRTGNPLLCYNGPSGCSGPMLEEDGKEFNQRWGYLSRAGLNDKSQFTRQIEKYAGESCSSLQCPWPPPDAKPCCAVCFGGMTAACSNARCATLPEKRFKLRGVIHDAAARGTAI